MHILIAVAALPALYAGWRVSLLLWPYTRCKRCTGSGKNAESNKHWHGACRKCGGSGRKERVGVSRNRKG